MWGVGLGLQEPPGGAMGVYKGCNYKGYIGLIQGLGFRHRKVDLPCKLLLG